MMIDKKLVTLVSTNCDFRKDVLINGTEKVNRNISLSFLENKNKIAQGMKKGEKLLIL